VIALFDLAALNATSFGVATFSVKRAFGGTPIKIPAISARLRTRCRAFGGNAAWKRTPVASGLGACIGPELTKRCRPHLKATNKSYRTDDTYIKVKGEDKYLYRAVDSSGETIEFLLTAKRDAAGAERFFRRVLSAPGNAVPRVINVDKNPAYPAAVEALKAEIVLPRRVQLRQCKYLNNAVEQDDRAVTKGVWLAKRYGSCGSRPAAASPNMSMGLGPRAQLS
jgi:hypothetical protein